MGWRFALGALVEGRERRERVREREIAVSAMVMDLSYFLLLSRCLIVIDRSRRLGVMESEGAGVPEISLAFSLVRYMYGVPVAWESAEGEGLGERSRGRGMTRLGLRQSANELLYY